MGLDEVVAEMRLIRAELQELKMDIVKYKGFVGGVLWVASGLAGFTGFLWSQLKESF